MLREFINRLINLWRPKSDPEPALEQRIALAVERLALTKSSEDFSTLSSLLSEWREQKGIMRADLSDVSEDDPEIVESEIIDKLACPECGDARDLTGKGTMIDGNWHTRWTCVCGFKFTVEEFDEHENSLQKRRANRR